jgi:hypothetical protein
MSPWHAIPPSLSGGLAGHTLPLFKTLAVPKPPAGSTEPVWDHSALLEPGEWVQTVRAMLNADWHAILEALITNLSDSILVMS